MDAPDAPDARTGLPKAAIGGSSQPWAIAPRRTVLRPVATIQQRTGWQGCRLSRQVTLSLELSTVLSRSYEGWRKWTMLEPPPISSMRPFDAMP